MKLSIFGTGYVGLVTGACLADVGHDVVAVDIDEKKVAALTAGVIPIHEPGLSDIVHRNVQAGRLRFTTDSQLAIEHGEVQMIAVGTPPGEDGSADLQHVLAVARTIGQGMSDYRLVITKSTVPVGTADRVAAAIADELAGRNADIAFDVASNPEFLKEGSAVSDFMKPDRIIVGTDSDDVKERVRELYAPFNRSHDRLLVMDVRSSELTKYAANALLATKISFMNEIAGVAERLGADIEQVRQGIGSDPRIGYHFIYPGCGYGGSCFPKDVRALVRTAAEVDMPTHLLEAVSQVNHTQKQVLFEKLSYHFGDDLGKRRIAVWGLAFKPDTDDMREAPSLNLIESLNQAGAIAQAYDPEAMQMTQAMLGNPPGLLLCGTKEQCLRDADALVICTEWKEFRSPDFDLIRDQLKTPVIIDGRNIFDPALMEKRGFAYYGVGRGRSIHAASPAAATAKVSAEVV